MPNNTQISFEEKVEYLLFLLEKKFVIKNYLKNIENWSAYIVPKLLVDSVIELLHKNKIQR